MTDSLLLGIDIGTSACKIAIFNRDGQVLASATEEYPVYYPHPGWAEQNPDEWWNAVCKAIKKVLIQADILPSSIAGIGIDGQSWSAIAINREGKVLCNTPIWMDTRAQEICDRLNQTIGSDRIFNLTGNALQPSYTTAKIIWYKENLPEVYEKIDKILQSNSFIAYKLTDTISQDLSQGYGLHCFDMRLGQWNEEMADLLGIPMRFLPPIVSSDTIVGTVTKKAAAETGLCPGIPVVAGGLDAACGTLGTGVLHAGETQEQGGQAGGMSICTEEYRADPRLILGYHVVNGRWLLQGGTVGGGGVMRWFEQEFSENERQEAKISGKPILALVDQKASAVPAGCDGLVFLPYMSGERSPIWNPKAKGVFFGLDFSKSRAHIARACMEGVAYSLKHNLDIAAEAGAEVQVLRSMGGASNSRFWTQMKADITGKPIVVPSSDTATTLGAVLLAGVAVGLYSDYEEAVRITVHETRSHQPNPALKSIYDQTYQKYRQLYPALKDLMK